MKNLLVYISPTKKLDGEFDTLAKIQIDNSLSLGQKREDIIFVTNFDYEYNGVKAQVVGDEHYCACRPRSIKTAIIPYLVEQGIVKKGEIYWNHDLDAFQSEIIEEAELGIENIDIGLTDYGWRERWCLGSFFFKESSKDIFLLAKDIILKNIEDESAMMELTKNNANNVNERSKRLNITYNLGQRKVESNYNKATKPIKVLHFHPSRARLLGVFMYGKNGMNTPLMSERLIGIFKQYGIK